ncbi:hypothetical protein KAJ27_17735, partial [bacterium]|nr:hypothetical protein [bacterium]
MHFLSLKNILVLAVLFIFILNVPVSARQSNGYNVYFGLFHAHNSEGGDDNKQVNATIEKAYTFARDKGKLDFFGLSPHSHMVSNEFHQRLKNESSNFKKSDFAVTYGGEWGVMSVTGHIGTLFSKNMLCDKIPTYDNQYLHLQKYFDFLSNDKKAIGILNHPETFDFGYYYNPIMDDRIVAVELFNGSAFATRLDAPRKSLDYEDQFLILLNRGWHLAAVANQDNHFMTWGLATNTMTGILADKLNSEEIRKAMIAGRTFATQDRNLSVVLTAKCDGNEYLMGERVFNQGKRGNAIITVTCDDPDGEIPKSITLFTDSVDCGALGKKVASSTDSNTLKFETPLDFTDRFYVAQIIQADGEHAWTSPIWITRMSEFQVELVKLMIAKKQMESVKKHLKYLTSRDELKKHLSEALEYLMTIEKTYSSKIYPKILKAKGNKLRKILDECSIFLENVEIYDAILFFKDLKKITSQIALTSVEGEYVKQFITETNKKFKSIKVNEAHLIKLATEFKTAKNYNTAAMIYHTLVDKFPEKADQYNLDLIAIYSSLEAHHSAISMGDEILSNPNLDKGTAIDAYLAKALAYKRISSGPGAAPMKLAALEQSLLQYQQLLKDYPRIERERKSMIEELIGDTYKKLMSKKKEQKKKMFVQTIKFYNKALKRTKVVDTMLKLHSKISGATLGFDTSNDAILEAIENFKTLMTSYTDNDDTFGFLKNISDLYLKLAKKDKAKRKEYLKESVKYA